LRMTLGCVDGLSGVTRRPFDLVANARSVRGVPAFRRVVLQSQSELRWNKSFGVVACRIVLRTEDIARAEFIENGAVRRQQVCDSERRPINHQDSVSVTQPFVPVGNSTTLLRAAPPPASPASASRWRSSPGTGAH
jgi:hypothetical protein